MSWYYYLEGKISSPFRARCLAANAVSPLCKGRPSRAYRWPWRISASVQIRWQGRNMAVPLSQLSAIDQTNQPTRPSAAGFTGPLGATTYNLRTAAESSPISMSPPKSC
jgi:hypothetical protein